MNLEFRGSLGSGGGGAPCAPPGYGPALGSTKVHLASFFLKSVRNILD